MVFPGERCCQWSAPPCGVQPPVYPSAGAGRRPHPWRQGCPAFATGLCLKGSDFDRRGPSSYCGRQVGICWETQWEALGAELRGFDLIFRNSFVYPFFSPSKNPIGSVQTIS